LVTTAVQPEPITEQRHPPVELAEAFGRLFSLQGTSTSEIYFIRHAEPDYEAARLNDDPWDPPLSAAGREQAMRVATRLQRGGLDAVYSSTMLRALETAAFVASLQGLPVRRVDGLREVSFDPEVLLREQTHVRSTAEEISSRFLSQPRWDALPGFEPSKQFRHRVVQAVEAIIAQHPGQRVAIVAHGGVINAYLSMVLDIPRDMFFLPAHSSLSTLRVREDLYALTHLNDVSHLSPALRTY